jgi:anti-sigma factor RsiW
VTCDALRGELLAFHLSTLEDPRRADVERHLAGCAACVTAFLTLKRDVDLSSTPAESPRPQLRASVRRAVALEMGLLPATRPWWERPLAGCIALAAVLVAITTVQLVATSPPAAPLGVARRAGP